MRRGGVVASRLGGVECSAMVVAWSTLVSHIHRECSGISYVACSPLVSTAVPCSARVSSLHLEHMSGSMLGSADDSCQHHLSAPLLFPTSPQLMPARS
jgi:hypothetical protein